MGDVRCAAAAAVERAAAVVSQLAPICKPTLFAVAAQLASLRAAGGNGTPPAVEQHPSGGRDGGHRHRAAHRDADDRARRQPAAAAAAVAASGVVANVQRIRGRQPDAAFVNDGFQHSNGGPLGLLCSRQGRQRASSIKGWGGSALLLGPRCAVPASVLPLACSRAAPCRCLHATSAAAEAHRAVLGPHTLASAGRCPPALRASPAPHTPATAGCNNTGRDNEQSVISTPQQCSAQHAHAGSPRSLHRAHLLQAQGAPCNAAGCTTHALMQPSLADRCLTHLIVKLQLKLPSEN